MTPGCVPGARHMSWARGLLLTLTTLLAGAALPAAAMPRALDAPARERLDRLAARHPLETAAQEQLDVARAVPSLVLAHVRPPGEEELDRARAAHEGVRGKERVAAAPEAARRALGRLVR